MIEEEEEKLILNNNKQNKTSFKKKDKRYNKHVQFVNNVSSLPKDVQNQHKTLEKSKNETSKATIEAINQDKLTSEREQYQQYLQNKTTSEREQYQQYLQNQIEMYRRELTDKNIVKLFTNPDTITDLLKKIKQQKKELIEPTKNKTKKNAKTKYNQLSALEDKLQIINWLYKKENKCFEKINEIDDLLTNISKQNDLTTDSIKLISIKGIQKNVNTSQKANKQENDLKQQLAQLEKQIIEQYNTLLHNLPSIKKIQKTYRMHKAQNKLKEYKKKEQLQNYIVQLLTFSQNTQQNQLQNINQFNDITTKMSIQDIKSKKVNIGFLESIFCCCSRSTIAKQEHNQLIDRFLQRVNADNNNNITVNLDTINTINNIKQAIRNN